MGQERFSKALLDPDMPVPPGIVDPDGRPAPKRFNVYRNNVVVSLADALEAAFPVVRQIVGDAFFRSMALIHARAHPPKDARMILYGEDFPVFLETFEPVSHLSYLPDVARLERARRESYHAEDHAPGGAEALAALPPEDLVAAKLVLHPSLRLVASEHPIFSIWRFNSTDDKSPITSPRETVLVARPHMDLTMNVISDGSAAFLQSLLNGQPLGVALETASAIQEGFDLSENLIAIFSAEILIGVATDNKS
jgi:hypothetical protein